MEISVDAWFCKNRKVKGFIMRKRDLHSMGNHKYQPILEIII